jgi:hypothetical protein
MFGASSVRRRTLDGDDMTAGDSGTIYALASADDCSERIVRNSDKGIRRLD